MIKLNQLADEMAYVGLVLPPLCYLENSNELSNSHVLIKRLRLSPTSPLLLEKLQSVLHFVSLDINPNRVFNMSPTGRPDRPAGAVEVLNGAIAKIGLARSDRPALAGRSAE